MHARRILVRLTRATPIGCVRGAWAIPAPPCRDTTYKIQPFVGTAVPRSRSYRIRRDMESRVVATSPTKSAGEDLLENHDLTSSNSWGTMRENPGTRWPFARECPGKNLPRDLAEQQKP